MNLFYDDFIWVCRQLLTKILGGLFEGLMYSSWMLFRSLSYYFFLTVSAYVGFAGDRLSRIYRVLWSVVLFVEICAISKISKKEIGRVFKLILKTLETSVDLITSGDFMVNGFENIV